MANLLRLNLGAGACPLPGFVNVDRGYDQCQHGETCCVPADVFPLHFPDRLLVEIPGGRTYQFWNHLRDESCSEVRASHILEHFSHRETMDVLTEWVRVLAPGGVLKVAVPDFEQIARRYLEGEELNVQGYVMGGHVNENDHHGAIFDEETLTAAFKQLGLVDVRRWESDVQDCAALPISLNLQARKPGGEVFAPEALVLDAVREAAPKKVRAAFPEPDEIHVPSNAIVAVMSMPRLCFADNMFCALRALRPLGITLEKRGGCFWDKAMARAFEDRLADPACRYVLTLDYDTVFTTEDVLELVRLLETRPEIDAICAMQARRESLEGPLFTVGEHAHSTTPREVCISVEQLRQEAMQVATGHFGLTLLRTSAIAKVTRPWSAPGSTPSRTRRGSGGRRRSMQILLFGGAGARRVIPSTPLTGWWSGTFNSW
jgi:hypothetical protein